MPPRLSALALSQRGLAPAGCAFSQRQATGGFLSAPGLPLSSSITSSAAPLKPYVSAARRLPWPAKATSTTSWGHSMVVEGSGARPRAATSRPAGIVHTCTPVPSSAAASVEPSLDQAMPVRVPPALRSVVQKSSLSGVGS